MLIINIITSFSQDIYMQRTGYFQHKIHKKPFATLRYADRAAGNHVAPVCNSVSQPIRFVARLAYKG